MNVLRNSFLARCLASFLLTTFVSQMCFPTLSMALTSGPSQPEVQSFQAANTTDMVNLFSGDFNYNIPLFELPGPNGGYPFNLAYNSGISMDQEASWVGLGWNLNAGALTREMRGLPDDFNGDQVIHESDMRNNITFGIGGSTHSSTGLEVLGFDTKLGLGIGMSIFYNSYNGVGFSLDPSASFSLVNKDEMNNSLGGVGMGLSLNSQEGIGFDPTVNIRVRSDNYDSRISVGLGYNSHAGLAGMNLAMARSKRNHEFHVHNDQIVFTHLNGRVVGMYHPVSEKVTNSPERQYLGSTYSFETHSYVPRPQSATQARNFSTSFLIGEDPAFFDFYSGVSGFFNTQWIRDKRVSQSAYGYMYMQNDDQQDDLIDYNRSQDGQIIKNTPYLPAPILTQDIYSANAQGMSAMYRPQRSDLGVIYDDHIQSQSWGGSLGAEYAFFVDGAVNTFHFGMDLTVNYSVTNSGVWKNNNNWLGSPGGFSKTNPFVSNDKVYEPTYFKVYGEMSSDTLLKFDAIGGYEPYRISLDDHTALSQFENDHGSSSAIGSTLLSKFFDADLSFPTKVNTQRKIRQTSVMPFKNGDVANVAGTFTGNTHDDLGNTVTGGLSEFKISYFTGTGSPEYKTGAVSFSRSGLSNDHIGGFVTTNPDGMKYVYALPAYNATQVECQFSVNTNQQYKRVIDIPKDGNGNVAYKSSSTNQTSQYYNKMTTPAYAHSYLLTSVLGSDYIDADDVVGPSAGDLGYWVKFSYVKAVNAYNWRTPFTGANYVRGSNTTIADDIGTYMYGTKEVWHLAKAETQTHVAVFKISDRFDGKSAVAEVQNSADSHVATGTSYKLDTIKLYSRDQYNLVGTSGKALVTAVLTYTYDLCGNVPNNINTVNNTTNNGKLTLKSLYFTYGDNKRGSLSPYVFDYHESVSAENPGYLDQAYDRWGIYKPYDPNDQTTPSKSLNTPYTQQFDPAQTAAAFRAQMDNQASVWTLKSIKLPSGGKIDVTYEADDYAYVQNSVATQMMPVSGVSLPGISSFSNGELNPLDLRIYFPLENAIPAGADIQKELQKYVPANNQVYFKVYSKFAQTGNNNEDLYEYVSGYADLETFSGSMGVAGGAPYTTGYVTLKKATFGGSNQYHPFALSAWLHVRTDAPYLLNIAGMKADPNTDDGQKTQKLRSLLSSVTEIKKIFTGFYPLCDQKGLGKTIDLSRSFIRLNSPDKIKIGGGLRVKQIVLSDSWADMTANATTPEITNYYGQVYNYTIEENGAVISSGVATNEPQIGGEESPLRYTKSYLQKIPALTPNRLMVELPINEAYYPAATVGYRKVTVKSIASNYSGITNTYGIPGGILRSGAVSYDFYTAKEFPVIEKYTNTVSHPFSLPTPIPFIGRMDINKLTMSQGYYIELNDMHGKLKTQTNYALDSLGNLNPQPIDYTTYHYQATPVYSTTGTQSNSTASNNGSGEIDSYVLNNKVCVLLSDNGTVTKAVRYMGQDVEFFTDMRETETQSYSGGGNVNMELEYTPPALFVTVFHIQPCTNIDYSRCRTTVSNKIVHKTGILSSIENYNQGSKTVAKYKLFDPYTGEPLLTAVTNSFEDSIYQYHLPAHLVTEYKRIGGKYATQQFKYSTVLTLASGSDYNYTIPFTNVPQRDLFQKGDKVFVTTTGGTVTRYPAVITTISSDAINLYGKVTLLNGASITSGSSYTIEMYDPVYDNNFGETAYSVTSLQDPTLSTNRVNKNCTATYTYPVMSQVCKTVPQPNGCITSMLSLLNSYFTTYPSGYYGNYSMNNANICKSPDAVSTTYQSLYVEDYTISFLQTSGSYANANTLHMEFWNESGQVNVESGSVMCTSISTPSFTGNDFYPNIISGGVVLDYNHINPNDVGADFTKRFYSKYKVHLTYNNGTSNDAYVFFWVQTDVNNKKYFLQMLDYTNASTVCKDTTLLTTASITPTFQTLNKILNVSASVFSEFKPLDDNSVANKDIITTVRLVGFDQLLAYLNGSAGNFRPKESWTYLDDRSQTTAVNTRTDGTFDDVPFFKYNSPLCKGCPTRWKRVVLFTDYFPSGTPQEEQDVLGNKSAVLFGYSGAQVTAVAPNTSVYEIGFESFEDYPNTSTSNTAPSLQNYYIGKNNLNFYTSAMSQTMDAFANYNIVSANQNMLVIDKPYNTDIEVLSVDVDGQDVATGVSTSGRYTVQRTQVYPGDVTKTILVLNTTLLNTATPWMGTGKFKLKRSSRLLNTGNITNSPMPSLQAGIAHTGKYSLIAPAGNIFEQRRLVITPGKKMVFEAWVKQVSPSATAGIRFFDKTGALMTASNIDFGLTTINVEGWVKIYGEFIAPVGSESIGIYLYGGTGQAGPGISYFDDIRIYPYESNMVSYVYDRNNFRLLSILDNNNFASYYYYDPSGKLYLTKKETERGIMTIQEAQSQIKAQ
jgi:hypothetical protein